MVSEEQTHDGRISALTLAAVIAAAPYPFAVLAVGLRAAAGGSYPRAFGVEWSSDSGYEFPNGGVAFFFGLLIVAAGIGLLATLLRLVRGSAVARWGVVAWLMAAIYVSYRVARRPDQSRRCFLDGYSDAVVCASARSVALRDFILLATPAAFGIVCALVRTPPKDTHKSPLRKRLAKSWANAAVETVDWADDDDRPGPLQPSRSSDATV